jgi:hypothetical protein
MKENYRHLFDTENSIHHPVLLSDHEHAALSPSLESLCQKLADNTEHPQLYYQVVHVGEVRLKLKKKCS